jgi:hypothetical protein
MPRMHGGFAKMTCRGCIGASPPCNPPMQIRLDGAACGGWLEDF